MPSGRKPQNFWAFVQVQEDGCWIWTGTRLVVRRKDGSVRAVYGLCYPPGDQVLAHVHSYRICIGPIPEGKQLDHLCRNTLCIHPLHLEPVTSRENSARGMTWWAVKARTGKYICGHDAVPENTTHGDCRICHRNAERERQRLKRLTDPLWVEKERARGRLKEQRRRDALRIAATK